MARGEVIPYFGGAFLLGIVAASLLIPFIAAILAAIFISTLLVRFRIIVRIFLGIIFLLGFFYLPFFVHLREASILLPGTEEWQARVVDSPMHATTYTRFSAELLPPFDGTIKIYAPPERLVERGDILGFRGAIEKRGFEWSSSPSMMTFVSHESKGFRSHLFGFKEKLINVYKRGLTAENSALLSGIMLGAKGDFGEKLKTDMQRSGTTHLVALSGYNISILIVALSVLFTLFLPRKTSFFIIVAAILAFVLMTGGEASIIRAAIMGFLVLFAEERGRIYDFKNAIIFAALLMVLQNPLLLAFDMGFILSFLSVLGLMYLRPILEKLLEKIPQKADVIRGELATTLSAQFAVLPVLVYQFSSISFLSILANILILWLIPFIMLLGFLMGILGLLAPSLTFAISWLLQILLSYCTFIMHFFARFETSIHAGSWIFFVWYGILIAGIILFRKKYVGRI